MYDYVVAIFLRVYPCVSYLTSCQEVLTEVYNQLMLPLPSDLSSSPDRPLSPEPSAAEGEGEDGGSSEDWTPTVSLEEPPAAPKLADLGVKRSVSVGAVVILVPTMAFIFKAPVLFLPRLARHTSFHDNQSHRQITVMNKKGRKRKRPNPKKKLEAPNAAPRR